MCTPEAYVAMQVVGAVTKYQADSESAKQINSNSQATAARLRAAAITDDKALQRKETADANVLADQKLKIGIQAKEKKGTAKLQLSEKGVGGNILDSIIGQISRQEGNAFNTIDNNYANLMISSGYNRLAQNERYGNQIFSLPRANQPSFGSYALQAGVNIAGMYISNAAPKSPSPQSNWSPDTSWMYTPNNLS